MKKVALVFLLIALLFGCGRLKTPDFEATLIRVDFVSKSWTGRVTYELEFDNKAILFWHTEKVPVFKIGLKYKVYKQTNGYVWKVQESGK